ncbi:MAG: VTT domain-containing protein [Candidatus Omnitrophica bacterium]|nr:VTT domain-containing protein [Candidatus Omnitrophota bacterium]
MNIKQILSNKTLSFLLFIGFLSMCFIFGKIFEFDIDSMRKFLSSFPIFLSGIIFVVLYVVLTSFIWFGPKDVFRIASAVLFGAYTSTILVWISEMLNAVVLFCLSRQLGQEFVEQKFRLKKAKIEGAKESAGIFGSFVLRINPLIPFRFQDLIAGLSRITLFRYILAISAPSFLRILWLQFLLAALGVSIFKNPDIVSEYLMANPVALKFSSFYFLLVIALSLLAGILKISRSMKLRSLRKKAQAQV